MPEQEHTTEKEPYIGSVRFFKNLLVFLVSALPTLVILAVLFFVLRPLFDVLPACVIPGLGRADAWRAKITDQRIDPL